MLRLFMQSFIKYTKMTENSYSIIIYDPVQFILHLASGSVVDNNAIRLNVTLNFCDYSNSTHLARGVSC